MWETPLFKSFKNPLDLVTTMRRCIIHMEQVSVPLVPESETSPDTEMLPHVEQQQSKQCLVDGLILVELHMQETSSVKEGDHH